MYAAIVLCRPAVRGCSASSRRAGALGILAAAPFALAVFIGGLFLPGKIFLMTGNFFADAALFVLLLFVSIPAHEGLHALGWAAVRGTFRGIRFGMAEGAPYCACEEPLPRGSAYFCRFFFSGWG